MWKRGGGQIWPPLGKIEISPNCSAKPITSVSKPLPSFWKLNFEWKNVKLTILGWKLAILQGVRSGRFHVEVRRITNFYVLLVSLAAIFSADFVTKTNPNQGINWKRMFSNFLKIFLSQRLDISVYEPCIRFSFVTWKWFKTLSIWGYTSKKSIHYNIKSVSEAIGFHFVSTSVSKLLLLRYGRRCLSPERFQFLNNCKICST